MKKIIILAGLSLLLCSACRQEFLELTPVSTIAPETFYKSAADAIAAVNGCYKSLAVGGQYNNTFHVLMETRGDNFLDQDPSSGAGVNYQINRFSDSPGNGNLYSAWVSIYSSIFRCNTVLEAVETTSMDANLKERVKAEATFIRALSYFNLIRLWGNVPLITKTLSPEEAAQQIRNPVTEVYAQIEKDLLFAAANLPETYPAADLGRVTKGAAQGLLGKVYLYQKKFSEASKVLNEVINGRKFSLLPNIADVFSPTVKYHAEILFAIRYAKGTAGQDHGFWYANTQVVGLDSTLFKAYDAVDTRRPMIEFTRPAGNSNILPRKYHDAPVNNNVGNDMPVLRYADVLLMQAEALNELGYNSSTEAGTAFAHLNAVRRRAKLPEASAVTLPTQEAFRREIYLQRRLELPFECDRWFDMVRVGTAIRDIAASGKKITIRTTQFLYPIPQQEIDIMNNPAGFPQNPQ
jgi:starch-binding outer membrane protein, SusD/RagB family